VKAVATALSGGAVFDIASVRVPVIHTDRFAIPIKQVLATFGAYDVDAVVGKELHGYVIETHWRGRVNAMNAVPLLNAGLLMISAFFGLGPCIYVFAVDCQIAQNGLFTTRRK